MHELLQNLEAAARVLDLGSGSGSFEAFRYPFITVRLDIEIPQELPTRNFVMSDAASMPFADSSFDAIISNHSLEHIGRLDSAISEIGRVLKPQGCLFISVPDVNTLADKIYRALGRGGGHVNGFDSATKLADMISARTGLCCRGIRVLYSSFSFLHPANRGRSRRFVPFAFITHNVLAYSVFLLRKIDLLFGSRLSEYGWALYFGGSSEISELDPWPNVCVHCGSGHPAAWLESESGIEPGWWISHYRCPNCTSKNVFIGTRAQERL